MIADVRVDGESLAPVNVVDERGVRADEYRQLRTLTGLFSQGPDLLMADDAKVEGFQ